MSDHSAEEVDNISPFAKDDPGFFGEFGKRSEFDQEPSCSLVANCSDCQSNDPPARKDNENNDCDDQEEVRQEGEAMHEQGHLCESERREESCDLRYVVKLRGLPWSATREELLTFMSGCSIRNGVEGVHLVSRHGPIRGEAYIELESEEDMEAAISKHRDHMGTRYIEVFRSNVSEMNNVLNPKMAINWRDPVVRLRGVPYYCTKDDIYDFFSGLQIAHNGVYMSMDDAGNANGLAFVAFTKMEMAQRALEKHRLMIGHRYVEVFQSCYAEARAKMLEEIEHNRRSSYYQRKRGSLDSEPYGSRHHQYYDEYDLYGQPMPQGGRYDSAAGPMRTMPHHSMMVAGPVMGYRSPMPPMRYAAFDPTQAPPCLVQMLGLPFSATVADIREFFEPLKPTNIELHEDGRGRPAGTASVEFSCHEDALEAMKHDKQYIGSRYIDLSLHSVPMHMASPSRSRQFYRTDDEMYGESGGFATSGMSHLYESQDTSRFKPEMF